MKNRSVTLFAIFIAPIMILLILFRYYPLFSGIYHSFTAWNVMSTKFVGIDNYLSLVKDDLFMTSLRNIFIYVLVTTFAITSMSIIGGELIFNLNSDKSKSLWKYLFVIPMIVPFTVSMLIWAFIYNPYLGILNSLLSLMGLGNFTFPWLGSPNTALYAVCFVGFPFLSSAQFLILMSSLQNIDHSIIDASKVDGATTLKRIFNIDIPLIIDKIFLIIMLTVIWNFQALSNFYILTYGGPGASTLVPGLYLYEMAFQNNSLGYACAIGIFMAIVTLAFILILQKVENLIEAHYA
ncbi:MAG: sugar ABC transporter permease [Candidatus Parvarchaeota archaeon]|nr:sugar ABC transporter permease [Candidatus Jingweiarchaeum tengchongense]